MPKTKTKEIVFSIPGWLSLKLEPNLAEQRAAWSLYVELSTRIASQPFNRDTRKLRAVLSSLYTLFEFTRQILRDGGPDVAHGPDSFGPVAIRFLTEVLAPFTTKWHEPLIMHEQSRPEGRTELEHERLWERYDEMLNDLQILQTKILAYTTALGELGGVR
jgi:hypothetical protein